MLVSRIYHWKFYKNLPITSISCTQGTIHQCILTTLLTWDLHWNSQTSIARTPIARLPWLIRTHFWVPRKFFRQLKKNKYLGKFYQDIVCCVYSSESPHQVHSTYNYCVENQKDVLNYRYLLPDLVPWLTLSGSNYPYLEQISMAPKMFEPLKFDCMYVSIHLFGGGGEWGRESF